MIGRQRTNLTMPDTDRCASTPLPWRIQLALTLAGVLAFYASNGYTFGWWDHSIHLPVLLRELDPSFLPGDYLLAAADSHLSLAWRWLAPLANALGTEQTFFVMHVALVTLMLTGSMALARSLFPRQPQLELCILTIVLVVPAQPTWAAILSMDDHLLPRGTIGILLHALALAVRERERRAYLLAGLVANVHATTAAHAAVLIWVHQALTTRNRKELLIAPGFLITAAPLAIHAFGAARVGDVPFPAPETWAQIANLAFPFHFEVEAIEPLSWICLGLQTACALAAWRHLRAGVIAAYVLAIAIICMLGMIAWEIFQVPFARQFHAYESTRFMHYLGMVGVAAVAATWWRNERSGLARCCLVALVLLVGPLRCVMLLAIRADMVWLKSNYVSLMAVALVPSVLIAAIPTPAQGGKEKTPRRARTLAMAAALLAGVLYAMTTAITGIRVDLSGEQPANPGVCDENPTRAEWRQRCGLPLMQWARTALPADACVAMPPYFFHPLTSWRHRTRRGVVATHKDGAESNFDLAFAMEWHARMTALAGVDPLPGSGVPGSVREWIRHSIKPYLDGYRRADEARLLALARRFGATHAVIERAAHEVEISMPVVYEDDAYRVYRIEE